MNTTTLILIGLAIVISAGLVAFQYLHNKKERSQLNYWLSFFRFFVYLGVFILLINPGFDKVVLANTKPILKIALDNSISIRHLKLTDSVQSISEFIKSDADLNEKFDIRFYRFGSTIERNDTLDFQDAETNYSNTISQLSESDLFLKNPIIIVTDGNQTAGSMIDYERYQQPVYPIIVGDTTRTEDIFISRINVNNYSYLNNQLPVEVFVNYRGDGNSSNLFEVIHQGKVVYSKMLDFERSEDVEIISFYLPSEESGNQFYTVRISPLPNEKNTSNNTSNFSVNIISEQTKILIISDISHPDIGMLKRAIETNDQRTVEIIHPSDELTKLNDYQLVIFYQPSQNSDKLLQQVMEAKQNMFIVTGLSTDWNYLNTSQSYFKKEFISASEQFFPELNNRYPIFTNTDIGFSNFAPIEDFFGMITFSSRYNTLLHQRIGSISSEEPLLATFETNGQKGAVLFGQNSWRWRMNSYIRENSFIEFDTYISNLVQYLSADDTAQRLNISVDPLNYVNKVILVNASYTDANYQFDNRAKLWLTITKNNQNISRTPMSRTGNQYQAVLSDLSEGIYEYTAIVEGTDQIRTGSFKVLPYSIEEQFAGANDDHFIRMTQQNEGSLYYSENIKDLIEKLSEDPSYKTIQKSSVETTPLIDWKILLGMLLLLLSSEWFLRKFFGKI